MSRLIDADRLIEQASKYHMFDYVTIKGLVDNQPTAYDVEGVLEKLDTWQRQSGDGLIAVGVAIDFVKGAVKDE